MDAETFAGARVRGSRRRAARRRVGPGIAGDPRVVVIGVMGQRMDREEIAPRRNRVALPRRTSALGQIIGDRARIAVIVTGSSYSGGPSR